MSGENVRLKQAGWLLGCSTRQAQSLVDRGLLPAFNVGAGSKRRSLRIPRSAIDAFMRERRVGPGTNGVETGEE